MIRGARRPRARLPGDAGGRAARIALAPFAESVRPGSQAGRRGEANVAVYCATKFAVRALTEGLRQEVKPHNIRTTIISPGAIATELLEQISQELARGARIEIRGFGSFSLHYRPPRIGRNPKTGESVALPGKYVPHFKPGKELRERVNGGEADDGDDD